MYDYICIYIHIYLARGPAVAGSPAPCEGLGWGGYTSLIIITIILIIIIVVIILVIILV